MTALRSRRRHGYIALGLATVAALTLAGCAEGGDEGDGGDGSLEGETVQISGGITGSEADNLQKSFDAFTADTGIEVVYTGDKGFEGNIVTKVAGGSAPDIAIVPQPGLFRSLVDTGEVQEGTDEVAANVDEYWAPAWKDYGSVDGTFYAAPMLANVKGYVYYSPDELRGVGRRDPHDVAGAARADRDDPGDDRYGAVVRRILVRGRLGLAGHRLDRRPRASSVRRRGVRQLGCGRRRVHRPRHRGRVRRGREDPARPRRTSTPDSET